MITADFKVPYCYLLANVWDRVPIASITHITSDHGIDITDKITDALKEYYGAAYDNCKLDNPHDQYTDGSEIMEFDVRNRVGVERFSLTRIVQY